MRDDELRSVTDYNAGQREAAKRVLIEITNLFKEYQDSMVVVGGWAPELLFPDGDHIGSVDVDVLCNHLEMEDAGYLTIKRILLKNGYTVHPDNFFSFQKRFLIEEQHYTVDLDLLAGTRGRRDGSRGQKFHGVTALQLKGGDFALSYQKRKVRLDGALPDGTLDSANVQVVDLVPFLVLKADALGRYKAKDSYDIWFILSRVELSELAEEFIMLADVPIIRDTITQLEDKFRSPQHNGPVAVANFLEVSEEEDREILQRDASERVMFLVNAFIEQTK